MVQNNNSEEKHNTKGAATSIAVHSVLIFMMLMTNISPKMPPQPVAKIEVELPPITPKDLLGGGPALGLENEGKGKNPSPGKPDPTVGSPTPKPTVREVEPKPTPSKPIPSKPTPAPTPQKPIQTTDDPKAEAIRRQEAETKRRNEQAKIVEEAENNRKAKQAAEAKAQADAKAKAEADAKSKFGNRFGNKPGTSGGGGTGTGQGNTNKPGNQGKIDGDPDSKVLTGVGSGAGTVNGFGGRGVRNVPRLQDNGQATGRVVMSVCINADGKVTSAKFKQAGSSTNDPSLIAAATRNAQQYVFKEGAAETQCGTITYDFKVR